MKIKDGYILKEVAGEYVVVPVCDPHFKAIITTNETGAFIFEKMKENIDLCEIAKLLTEQYEIDMQTASSDVKRFAQLLLKAGLADE
ncbi:MAG: PqqD family protein [Clostridia bacterium]|nr:PqqD family protein [Clostridia bacterium]